VVLEHKNEDEQGCRIDVGLVVLSAPHWQMAAAAFGVHLSLFNRLLKKKKTSTPFFYHSIIFFAIHHGPDI